VRSKRVELCCKLSAEREDFWNGVNDDVGSLEREPLVCGAVLSADNGPGICVKRALIADANVGFAEQAM
jgi:hypothetical protein